MRGHPWISKKELHPSCGCLCAVFQPFLFHTVERTAFQQILQCIKHNCWQVTLGFVHSIGPVQYPCVRVSISVGPIFVAVSMERNIANKAQGRSWAHDLQFLCTSLTFIVGDVRLLGDCAPLSQACLVQALKTGRSCWRAKPMRDTVMYFCTRPRKFFAMLFSEC